MSESENRKLRFNERDLTRLAREYGRPMHDKQKQQVLEKARQREKQKQKRKERGREMEM